MPNVSPDHSSAGRAEDCRVLWLSLGRWFDSGWSEFFYIPSFSPHLKLKIQDTSNYYNNALNIIFFSTTLSLLLHGSQVEKISFSKLYSFTELEPIPAGSRATWHKF